MTTMIIGKPPPPILRALPGTDLHRILKYAVETWGWLLMHYPNAHTFSYDEPALSRSFCEALNDDERKRNNGINGEFVTEAHELLRKPDGTVIQYGRTDIKFIFGGEGAPVIVIECKKLDGDTPARRAYCNDGVMRFVSGKYAKNNPHGIMCGFSTSVSAEQVQLAAYISDSNRSVSLHCIVGGSGSPLTQPSICAPTIAIFDTTHNRPNLSHGQSITLAHLLLDCPIVAQSRPGT